MYTLQARHQHGVAHTLTGEGHDASEDGTGRGTPIVAAPLTRSYAKHGGASAGKDLRPRNIVMASGQANAELAEDLSPTLNLNHDGAPIAFDTTQVTSPGNYSHPKSGQPCHPLAEGGHPPAIAFQQHGSDVGRMGALRRGRGDVQSGVPFIDNAVPRRLTPRECERLMGWPDDWTRWGADGSEISDSARYRMCGNGVVASVSEWIGRRIVAAHERSEAA